MAIQVSLDQLGSELKRVRESRGLSLRAVQGETDISTATLSRIERGSTPDLSVVERLAHWMEISVCAGGGLPDAITTDEDLRRTIAVHLRATKNLPEPVAHAIVTAFDLVMQIEMRRAGINPAETAAPKRTS